MKQIALALLSLLLAGAALAQEQVTPEVPFSTPAPLVRVTPDPNDARSASCSAPSAEGYAPYVVRPGDTLAGLIAADTSITVTQLAALNCLDDPSALPVGAVIWLPAPPPVESIVADATAEASAQSTTSTDSTSEATAEASTTSAADTPEATAEVSAIIQSFNADLDAILNTDSVTLSWLATGDAAYVYPCFVEACSRPSFAQPLPVEASVTLGGFHSAGAYRYRLEVTGAGGPVTRDTAIDVTCAQEWLGGVGASPRCPDDPARNVYTVWQPFEHGVMLWFSDTAQVYVMTDDGQLNVYEDVYVEGQPDPADLAPEGLFTPVRGFGQIWLALGGEESSLGWATTGEIGYDGARQAAGRTSYTTYIQGPGSNVYAVTQIPGAESGWWAQVAW